MNNNCQKLECAAICEYGFKLDENGCHTCKCDDPCDGYLCPEDEECINVKDATCSDFLCPTLPVCKSNSQIHLQLSLQLGLDYVNQWLDFSRTYLLNHNTIGFCP